MHSRAKHEIEHGKYLAQGNTEQIWGWTTPAGRVRAKRRATLISSGEFLEACFDKIDKISKVGYLAACCGVIH